MIGTLISLILMLQNLSDTASLGPNMAVALVTTFYGVVLANLVFTPISKKLKDTLINKALAT
jgi:chemotaxis protein MotA